MKQESGSRHLERKVSISTSYRLKYIFFFDNFYNNLIVRSIIFLIFNIPILVNLNNPYEVRMVNDKVMQIERTFLITAPDDWPRHKSYSFIKTK